MMKHMILRPMCMASPSGGAVLVVIVVHLKGGMAELQMVRNMSNHRIETGSNDHLKSFKQYLKCLLH